MVRSFLLALSLITTVFSSAQLQSPEQFLGYKIGTRYTPHWRIAEYFRHAAAQAPQVMQLQQYGVTNEGRPLLLATISSAQNISGIDRIRQNNLALAQMGSGGGDLNAPAIVWLSYNVHGNETSSSEAALMTLWALLDPANAQSKTYLQNTVVLIDPCLNPDGRDRYVNWYNGMVGRNPNPEVDSREHREPWPGGRVNHYYFDLNRDWAWQTQVETQQRIKLYNQWMPHVHVDFHEQHYNDPYYFAPAAQPYHELITPFQRKFQETIGRNHARYFDEKGWLYFTKERFDLLYPAYGDSYPIYNGAIGMTYEQGGGPSGGSAVITAEGDTLTLLDRATHHYTTGLSTIEVASKNKTELVNEFARFFRSGASTGSGSYASYVIKRTAADEQKIRTLTELLNRNGIRWGTAQAGSGRGLNFNSKREEAFTLSANDIVVPVQQAKSVLTSVLFEPDTKVVDSATYDITAWALPYAYGLNAFASRTAVRYNAATTLAEANTTTADAGYGYAFSWSGLPSVKLAAALLNKGVRLRYTSAPFEAGGQRFDRGAVLVLRTGNNKPGVWNDVKAMASANNISLAAINSGFVDKGYDFGSESVRPMKARRVALLTGEGTSANAVGEVWHFFDQQLQYPVTLVNTTDFGNVKWSNYDVIVMPHGGYRFLNDKASADALKTWVQSGGQLIALEGAVQSLTRQDWSVLKSKKAEDSSEGKSGYEALRRFENRERDFISNITPGSVYKVELDNSHPLAFGYPGYYYTTKQDDVVYEFIKQGGWNVGVIKRNAQLAGFVGNNLRTRLQDGTVFATQNLGRGNVIYLADNLLFRAFWEGGKLMFGNAVFLVGQ